MKIKVMYFAFMRDAMGRSSEVVDAPESVKTISELRAYLMGLGDPWASAFANVKRVRSSVNQVMAAEDAPVKAGDEVAFFPPVTGG
ncbi:molybdopterin converting factor subunit 1 [Mesosutterella sp. OilRF-GAM-744-9]|uniref:Molybdopterin synthase sulfur carrier subunit n=1 Tax=Mesosutterella porci TaxID=2915351 RepID=A0ABS9MTC0_9BURK|nr:molybdopterin converting factor subunit 1 [Mesosutterella sp. oilRF-744-WT-GAM-9]MCG5031854.1 molybdopterin converting factor subunit 1 [Mesosutterella sp. oilRF-744-WT-GAM-9]MCI6529869.1 molybdopterin converting factor subunit 1 [Mesosutterella sp.]